MGELVGADGEAPAAERGDDVGDVHVGEDSLGHGGRAGYDYPAASSDHCIREPRDATRRAV